MSLTNTPPAVRILSSALLALAFTACGAGAGVVESTEVAGADEETAQLSSELSSAVAVGSTLQATTGVNLRTGPSTGYRVLLVVPAGAKVTTVERTTPQNAFYKVKYGGTIGYSHGGYYKLVSSPSGGGGGHTTPAPAPVSSARDEAIARARSVVGFSYWWGHGRFLPQGSSASTRGSCSGSCPSCGHSGSYGADCSGFVAKAWQVPASNDDVTSDSHPYSTWNFDNESSGWHNVSRAAVQKADAMVYNANGGGHMFLYESGDGWGSMWAYECKGCSYGCVHNLRTTSSAYKAISHNGW